MPDFVLGLLVGFVVGVVVGVIVITYLAINRLTNF